MSHHWHVATGLAGYGPDASDDNWTTVTEATDLADAIQSELIDLAGFEYESANAIAESEDYRAAWLTLKNGEALDTLAQNFDNKRANAPLYADHPKRWAKTVLRMARETFPVDFREGNSRLYVWECDDEHDDWLED